ncbi:hypothetical protein Y1Q_0006567 [Alligator mississippiensis]|uniref:DDE Tnp4 domain-containing protein n=1 Tax=Alligator mississippiensis TaxID=8496 RepID=A0A151NTG1_ALLMI|nr:hypothetical protein Y1Q_0006567 [Alligator mississippiensis]
MKLAILSILYYVTNQFSVGKSMTRETVQQVCLDIQNVLANHFIHLINLQEVVASFYQIGFSHCTGTTDSTHIPILFLPQGTQAFSNHKGYFSIILQGYIDYQVHFTHIFIGWVSRTHDAHIFHNSPLPLNDGE